MGSSGVGVGEGAGVLVLRSLRGTLGFERLPAWGVLAWGGAPVIVLWLGGRCPGLWGGLLSLLAYLGWRRCGIRTVGSSRVEVREGAGVLVLRSFWGALGFEQFCCLGRLGAGRCFCPRPLGGGALSRSLGWAPFPVGVLVLGKGWAPVFLSWDLL